MEQVTQNFNATDEQIIEDNEKWFKFFVYLPKIATIAWAVCVFITGIVLAAAIDTLCLIIWTGLVVSPLIYAIIKLALSYKILHIYYLKRMANGYNINPESDNDEDLPEI